MNSGDRLTAGVQQTLEQASMFCVITAAALSTIAAVLIAGIGDVYTGVSELPLFSCRNLDVEYMRRDNAVVSPAVLEQQLPDLFLWEYPFERLRQALKGA